MFHDKKSIGFYSEHLPSHLITLPGMDMRSAAAEPSFSS